MSVLPPAVADLERRLGVPVGSLAAEDLARAESALEDAATLILAEVPAAHAAAWTVESDPPELGSPGAPQAAVVIALKAARREFENPRGLAQESLGEHSVSLSDSSGVYLTAQERRTIRRLAHGSRYFVGDVRTPSAYAGVE